MRRGGAVGAAASITGIRGTRVSEQLVAPFTEVTVGSERETICLVFLEGRATLTERGATSQAKPGFLVVRRPGWRATLRTRTLGVRAIQFSWSPSALESLGEFGRSLMQARSLTGRSSVELAWRARNELLLRDALAPLALQLWADGVVVSLARNTLYGQASPPDLAVRAQQQIERQLKGRFDAAALARRLGCSSTHLGRVFKAAFGYSISEHVVRRRLEIVRELLLTTDRSVASIALEAGFHDASHLARHFRRLMTVSPSEFRRLRASVVPVPTGSVSYRPVAGART